MGLKVLAFTNYSQEPFWVAMVGTSDCDKNYHIYREKSDVFTLEYVLDGQGSVAENDKSVIAVKGDTWLLHTQCAHSYYTDPDKRWKKIWVNFGGPVAENLIAAYGLNDFFYPRINILAKLEELHRVLANCENQKAAFNKCAVIFMRICQQLHNEHYNKEDDSQGTIAEEMKKYIDVHSEIDISFNDMVEQMHCSKAYAIRSFKKKYNITPYQYILMRKVEMAKSLLLGTNMSISDISGYLGMCDSQYFSKYFKKHTGVSPTEFREVYKKKR